MPLPVLQESRGPMPTRASQGPPGEDLGFFGTIGASFEAVAADSTMATDNEFRSRYDEIVQSLRDVTGKPYDNWMRGSRGGRAAMSYDEVWQEVLAAKADGHFADLPDTRAEFDDMVLTQFRDRVERAERNAAEGGFIANFIGGTAGAFRDPGNLLTLAFGGFGKTVAQRVGTAGVSQIAIQLGLLPSIQNERELQGRRDLTAEEGAMMVLFAGAGGAGFQGFAEGARVAAPALFRRLPEPVQRRLNPEGAREADIVDAMIEDVEQRGDLATQAERDAASLLSERRRERQQSLLGDNGASRELDDNLMAEAMDELMSRPAPERAPQASSRTEPVPFGDDGAEARFMVKVRRAESGGDDAAKNPQSSATGRYQFINSTWLRMYVSRFGRNGLSDEQILAKRGNGAIQDQLMRDLTAENAAFLRSQGQAVTEGNLYLVHFAGPGNAKKLFDAPPNARVEDVLPAGVIEANGFLRGMSASDAIRWAHGKMGKPGLPPSAGARAQVKDGIGGAIARNQAEADAIQDQLDEALTAEDAARRAMQADPEDPALAAIEAEPVMVRSEGDDVLDESIAPLSPDAEPEATFRANELVETMRELVEDTKVNLNDMEALAKRIGADASEVESALDRLVGMGNLNRAYRTVSNGQGGTTKKRVGKFMRKRQSSYMPRDYIGQLAALGGIEPNGLGAREVARLEAAGLPVKGHDLRNSGHFDQFIPGVGPLLRPGGRGLDEIGEELWERGVFRERPTEREVMDWFEDVLANKREIDPETGLPFDDATEAFERFGFPSEGAYLEYRGMADNAARAILGRDLTDAEFKAAEALEDQMAGFYDSRLGQSADEWMEERLASAILANVEREVDDLLDRVYLDTEDPDYDLDTILDTQLEREAALARESREGQAAEQGAARGSEGESNRGEGDNRPDDFELGKRLADLPDEERAPFADPEGEAATRQVESLEHDVRASLLRPVERTTDAPREGVLRGEPNMIVGKGDVVQTATGRETTPVPNVAGGTDRKAANAVRRLDAWLIENAQAEAKARGDDFNGPVFDQMEPKKLSPSDRETLNEYLFGDEQPPILQSPFKELSQQSQVPKLDDGSGSWIVRDRETGEAVFETAEEAVAAKVNQKKYEVLTAKKHLASLNDNGGATKPGTPASNSTAGPTIARLEADGWTRNGQEFTKRIEGYAEAGTVSDGARTITLRLDERERYLSRLEGFDEVNEVDLRRYPDDPDAAIKAVMGERVDPSIAERRRQEAQLRAEAPLRGENATGQAQDGTMGLGLFDEADQPKFQLEEDAEPVSASDLLTSLDDEAAELKTLRDCL